MTNEYDENLEEDMTVEEAQNMSKKGADYNPEYYSEMSRDDKGDEKPDSALKDEKVSQSPMFTQEEDDEDDDEDTS